MLAVVTGARARWPRWSPTRWPGRCRTGPACASAGGVRPPARLDRRRRACSARWRWCCWPGQQTIAGVALGWVAAQVCFNAMLAALTAAVPDRVPVAQRGGGLRLGRHPAGARPGRSARCWSPPWSPAPRPGYMAMAPWWSCCCRCRSRCSPATTRCRGHSGRRCGCARWSRSFWISPRRHPDFAWAWVTRFLVQLGNALGTLYLLYFLTDGVRYPDPEARPAGADPALHGRHDAHRRGRRAAAPTGPGGARST